MKRIPTVAIVVVAILVAALAWWLLFGSGRSEPTLSGYIEADNLDLAAPQSGVLQSLSAREGEQVAAAARHHAGMVAPLGGPSGAAPTTTDNCARRRRCRSSTP
jgi:hypothetical protein